MKPKIVSYLLEFNNTAGDLEQNVNALIGEGFQPLGAPFVAPPRTSEGEKPDDFWYYQAMVKYEEPEA